MRIAVILAIGLVTPPVHALDCVVKKELRVDADGAPDSYRVDGNGLSYTCDGVYAIVDGVEHNQDNDKEHWQALCKEHWARARATGDYSQVHVFGFEMGPDGRPVVQGPGDPLPGAAYLSTTSMKIPGTAPRTQAQYVNASEIPYVVWGNGKGLARGDMVIVVRPSSGRVAYAIFGDCCRIGEGSVRLHQDLGSNPISVGHDGIRRAKRGIEEPVGFVPLPGVHPTPTTDVARWRAEIKRLGDEALAKAGGVEAIKKICSR